MDDSNAVISETGRVALKQRKILNVAQELMANTTTVPMPKHVGLSLHILKKTGSKELVRISK